MLRVVARRVATRLWEDRNVMETSALLSASIIVCSGLVYVSINAPVVGGGQGISNAGQILLDIFCVGMIVVSTVYMGALVCVSVLGVLRHSKSILKSAIEPVHRKKSKPESVELVANPLYKPMASSTAGSASGTTS